MPVASLFRGAPGVWKQNPLPGQCRGRRKPRRLPLQPCGRTPVTDPPLPQKLINRFAQLASSGDKKGGLLKTPRDARSRRGAGAPWARQGGCRDAGSSGPAGGAGSSGLRGCGAQGAGEGGGRRPGAERTGRGTQARQGRGRATRASGVPGWARADNGGGRGGAGAARMRSRDAAGAAAEEDAGPSTPPRVPFPGRSVLAPANGGPCAARPAGPSCLICAGK